MGFELNGENPGEEWATCFRLSGFELSVIEDVCRSFAPEEAKPMELWNQEYIYGEGLRAEECVKLAARLRHLIAVDDSTSANDNESPEITILGYIVEVQEKWRADKEGNLYFSIGVLRDFVSFLEVCGGFHIS